MSDPRDIVRPADRRRRQAGLPAGLDPAILLATHEATRALLNARTPVEVVDVVLAFVESLGGEVIPARLAGPDALPLDLSFGVYEPLLPRAEPTSIPRLHLETLMPGFLDDARCVVMELRHRAQLRDEATHDALTGLMTRRALTRQLYQLRPGDAVAMIDFDDFKRLNHTDGHEVADAVLAAFAQLLSQRLRTRDLAARYGGDEIVVAALKIRPEVLVTRLDEVRHAWSQIRPHPSTFSAGVVPVTTTGDAALRAADEALHRARRKGHDRTELDT